MWPNSQFPADLVIFTEEILNWNFQFLCIVIYWWATLFVRVSYWGQVVEMNFGSISFDRLLKFVSFPSSWVIYNDDALLMMYYHTGIYFPEQKIWKIQKHSLKY